MAFLKKAKHPMRLLVLLTGAAIAATLPRLRFTAIATVNSQQFESRALGMKQVLVVDESPVIRKVARRILEQVRPMADGERTGTTIVYYPSPDIFETTTHSLETITSAPASARLWIACASPSL